MQNGPPIDEPTTTVHQLSCYNPPADHHWEPVFADDALLVVNKPAGLLTVPGRGEHVQDCLIKRVQLRYPTALIVHRLDMDTSGLVLLSLGSNMQRLLSGLFMQRQVTKQYQALVHGHPTQDTGEIDLPLATDWPRRPRQMVDLHKGKPSKTIFQVLPDKNLPLFQTRLLLTPLTGRSHQLRVHCQAIGHPIVGDRLYASQASLVARLMLHATDLSFFHPVSGKNMTFSTPCPF